MDYFAKGVTYLLTQASQVPGDFWIHNAIHWLEDEFRHEETTEEKKQHEHSRLIANQLHHLAEASQLQAMKNYWNVSWEFWPENPVNMLVNGTLPLIIATRLGNEEMVKFLVDKGAKVDSEGADERSSIDWARDLGYWKMYDSLRNHSEKEYEDY